MGLVEAALSEQPDDPSARELYAVTHLARAIRLSDKGPEALAILHELATADPTNKQVPFAIRKIERPCPRCGDTGFCSRCLGRGIRRTLGLERKCEACYGRGICPACGVL